MTLNILSKFPLPIREEIFLHLESPFPSETDPSSQFAAGRLPLSEKQFEKILNYCHAVFLLLPPSHNPLLLSEEIKEKMDQLKSRFVVEIQKSTQTIVGLKASIAFHTMFNRYSGEDIPLEDLLPKSILITDCHKEKCDTECCDMKDPEIRDLINNLPDSITLIRSRFIAKSLKRPLPDSLNSSLRKKKIGPPLQSSVFDGDLVIPQFPGLSISDEKKHPKKPSLLGNIFG